MALTPEQLREAEELYVRVKITPQARNIADAIEHQRKLITTAEERIKELQAQCPHPMLARKTKNHGTRGDWDERTYWTHHICDICGLRWNTNQRWEYVGSKLGLPDDKEAKEEE